MSGKVYPRGTSVSRGNFTGTTVVTLVGLESLCPRKWSYETEIGGDSRVRRVPSTGTTWKQYRGKKSLL